MRKKEKVSKENSEEEKPESFKELIEEALALGDRESKPIIDYKANDLVFAKLLGTEDVVVAKVTKIDFPLIYIKYGNNIETFTDYSLTSAFDSEKVGEPFFERLDTSANVSNILKEGMI